MHGGGAAQRVRRDLRESYGPYLALALEIGQGAHRLLDRPPGIDPVDVVKIDGLDIQPAQRSLAGTADVVRAVVYGGRDRIRAAHEAEFGGHHDLRTPAGQETPDQLLIAVRAVGVRRIQKIDAELEGAPQYGNVLSFA